MLQLLYFTVSHLELECSAHRQQRGTTALVSAKASESKPERPSLAAIMEEIASRLRGCLSEKSAILTPGDTGFATALERWTNIDRQMPALIAQPTSERDVAVLVSDVPTAFPQAVDNQHLIS